MHFAPLSVLAHYQNVPTWAHSCRFGGGGGGVSTTRHRYVPIYYVGHNNLTHDGTPNFSSSGAGTWILCMLATINAFYNTVLMVTFLPATLWEIHDEDFYRQTDII